ncbi:hypothetical protein EI94DRAFT_1744444 [Lactarius quietus]|nr:hypothetical protein EI94DRAFT_1744444 [Lactarius quietus]
MMCCTIAHFSSSFLQLPPTAECTGPTVQPDMPAYQQGEDATTQSHSCPRCSLVQCTQVRPTTEYPLVEQQVPRFPRSLGVSSPFIKPIPSHC